MIRECLLLSALVAAPALADEAPAGWAVNSIPWSRAAPNGTKFALLEGVREEAGRPFSYAFLIPAGVWDGPHVHSATARVFVAQGALRIGYGATLKTAQAVTYPVGSYVVVPAGEIHFDGAEVETIIIGTATGPWTTTYVDGSAPASAGTPIAKEP